jgi:hypothetical protein
LEAVAGGRNAFGTKTRILTVMLVREPGNVYEANAVRVEAAGAILGYLSGEDAPRFHVLLDRLATTGIRGTCRAILTGGWDHGHGDRGLIGIKVLTGRNRLGGMGGPDSFPPLPGRSIRRSRWIRPELAYPGWKLAPRHQLRPVIETGATAMNTILNRQRKEEPK